MARIRTLKPEWLDDERLGALSDAARLLSVSLLLLADDWGNGRAADHFLVGRVWGYSADGRAAFERCSCAIRELAAVDFIQLYEHRGQSYYHVRKWFDHQKVDKPGRPLCPVPAWVVTDLPDRWKTAWRGVVKKYGVEPFGPDSPPDPPNGSPNAARIAHEPRTTDRDRDQYPDQDRETRGRARAREAALGEPGSSPGAGVGSSSIRGEECHAEYLRRFRDRQPAAALTGYERRDPLHPRWEKLAALASEQAALAGSTPRAVWFQVLDGFFASAFWAPKLWPVHALESQFGELYAAGAPEPFRVDVNDPERCPPQRPSDAKLSEVRWAAITAADEAGDALSDEQAVALGDAAERDALDAWRSERATWFAERGIDVEAYDDAQRRERLAS